MSSFPVQVVESGFPVEVTNADAINLSLLPAVAKWDFSLLDFYADGAKVPVVEDAAGFGNHLVNKVDTTQPTKGTFSGLPVINFNGSQVLANTSLGANTLVSAGQDVPFTIVMVLKCASTQPVDFPAIFKSGAATAPLTVILDNSTAAKTGSIYLAGNALTSSIRGKSLMDDAWHVVIMTFDALSSITWVDGFLVNTQTTGNMLLNKIITPTIGANFTGSIGEITLINQRVDQNSIHKLTQQLRLKWGLSTNSRNVSNGPASTVFEDTVTPDGSTVRIWTPVRPATDAPLIIYCHPQGQNEKITASAFAFPLVHASMSMGWFVAASSMGTASTPGGTGSSWGNATAQESILELYALMSSRRTFTKVILIGASMGGAASALAVIKATIPNIKGVYFIDAALSLLSMYKLSAYTATVDAGYSITSGTLSAASLSGANSISSSISFPAGTSIMIDPNGTNPEQAITGVPSGAGPFTIPLTTALSFAHASGVKVSDYGTKTAGNDPMLAPVSNFTSLKVRFLASATDTTTVQANHTTPFQAMISGIANESAIVQHQAGHLAGGATQSQDFIDFVERVIVP